ncbi:hypothetical protein [Stutzerimonas stutzeri]|uniref:ZIP Zinc transporter n=1 Tax=Stutzerimonas stutzeri TaxID=316 RepID=A0A6I6LSD9_STUST|nr:hypothetical protein [Stutzerimonas stutzeri]QGZ31296.1 hypothetical protein GQA94_14925 [Stutzerimonas stutzeri]
MFASLVAAVVLAAVHLGAGYLHKLNRLPRSRWLSMAGGVSVAYVFVHLLPELARGQAVMDGSDLALLSYLEHHAYLLALLGLAAFYGLERAIKKHRSELPEHAPSHAGVFWLHIGAFAIYNGLIGYLLMHGENSSLTSLVLYCVAMGLHFLVNDVALQSDHQELFRRRGRWLLALMPLAGWALGATIEASELAVSALTAFVGGSIILNVLKEELPEERKSRFGAFMVGVAGYSALLLSLQGG